MYESAAGRKSLKEYYIVHVCVCVCERERERQRQRQRQRDREIKREK